MSFTDAPSMVASLLRGSRRLPTLAGAAYDFIIVGGGTAGLVLANRLTEDDDTTVCVLEAGEDLSAHPRVVTPALFATMLGSDADWNLVTEPQDGLNGRSVNVPLGRALGGSSAINGQIFIPTPKHSLDSWETLGNPGWNWQTMASYFKKTYTLNTPTDPNVYAHLHLEYIDEAVNGKSGPIQASFPEDTKDPLPKAWVETMEALGQPATEDPFSGTFTGAYTSAATINAETRSRSYAASAYLKPVMERKNLTVITGAYVQRVLLTGMYPNVIATGVEYVKESEFFSVQVKEQVILAAGALNSPKLLELSGIGGNPILEPLGVHPVIDNPNVGENLQDNPMASISFEVREGIKTLDDMLRLDLAKIQIAMKEYTEKRSGPLAVNGMLSHAYLALPPESQKTLAKSMFKHHYDSDTHPIKADHTAYVKSLLLDPKKASVALNPYAAQGNYGEGTSSGMRTSNFLSENYYSISASLLQPLSRGSVHIASTNPSTPSTVDPRYLSHSLDLEVFAHHMAFVSKLIDTAPLKDLLKPDGLRNTAAPEDLSDVEAMKKYLKNTALGSWNLTGTCAMLPEGKGGVVNERLVVYGTRNLRVVDASVFPIATSGNAMATVYAVAERASDIIKEDSEGR